MNMQSCQDCLKGLQEDISLYCAWCCMQVWNEECTEDEVLAMCCRTGLCTTMGSMLRDTMSPLNQGSFGEWTSDLFLPVSYFCALHGYKAFTICLSIVAAHPCIRPTADLTLKELMDLSCLTMQEL